MTWSEDSLHRWLQKRTRPKGLVGSMGHDGAVLADPRGRIVLCTDACIEGVHFESSATAKSVGAKAAGRCLSDLAACAAQPQSLLAAVRAPAKTSERYLREVLQGLDKMGTAFGAPLVGGDLSCAPGPLSVTVTAQGRLPGRNKPVGRDRAKPGMVLVLTGPVGGSLLGRHLKIEPRIEQGMALFAFGATVLMDVSDGLALDLSRIARMSGVGMALTHVPVHRDANTRSKKTKRSALEHALMDGEDHELIACLPKKDWLANATKLQRRFPGLVEIGQVTRGKGIVLPEDCPVALPKDLSRLGWLHAGP